MQTKSVPSKWILEEGLRLDSGPYMSGAVEAKKILEKLSAPKEPLQSLTNNGIAGIYHAGRIKRLWVDSPKYGYPFLSSTDILQADLSQIRTISRISVSENPQLVIHKDWTLITRSGSIGKTAYARSDMDGMACTEDVLRVVPDRDKILPGYLYAYLSSKFGIPLVTSGTYGAIIQHIEPSHIANLPVPRLGHKIEEEIHSLVQEAANLRSCASIKKMKLSSQTQERLGIQTLSNTDVTKFGISSVRHQDLDLRLDGVYHCPSALEAEKLISSGIYPTRRLVEVAKRYFKPPLFKRLWVDSSEYGRQFVSGVDAYRYQAEEIRYVSHKTPNFDQFILKKGWLVFQAAGQIYGLFAQPLYVHGWLENLFCADDVYRIVPHNEYDGAYLYAFFRTQHGQALLKRQASGNSIPRVWDPHMRRINVVWPDEDLRHEIAKEVIDIHKTIEKARILESQAIRMTNEVITELGQQ